MTSIKFFEELDVNEKYDIIFIDGCLYEYNVMTDVLNGLKHLSENGTIVLLSSSHEGRGYHSLIAETGAKLYNDPKKRKGFPMRIFFFSPNISEQDLYHFYQRDMGDPSLNIGTTQEVSVNAVYGNCHCNAVREI